MATIGSMIVNVLANTAGFVNGMNTVRGELKHVRTEAAIANRALLGLGNIKSIISGLGIGITGVAVTRALTTTAHEIDRLVKTSDRLGITTQNLRGLEHGAGLAGVSSEELSSAMGFMSKQLAEAAHGAGKAKDVIKELGLNAKQLAQMTPDEALLTFTRSLAGVKDETEKVRIAMRVFGNAGQPLLTLLNEGENAIRGYMEEAERMKLTYSKEEADKVVAFNDAWERLSKTIAGFQKEIVINIAPAAIKFVEDLTFIIKWIGSFGEKGLFEDVRTFDDKPSEFGSWLPDWMKNLNPFFDKESITRNTIERLNRKQSASGRGVTDQPQFDNSLGRGRLTEAEIRRQRDQSKWFQDPRFRPPVDAEGERARLGRMFRPVVRRITGPAEIGVNAVVAGYEKAAKGLVTIQKLGEQWGKDQMIQRLLNPPSNPFYADDMRKAKEEAERKAERDAESRFRMMQPAPTAARGSAASREQIRQSQQQAAQLQEARNANLHLRGIKDALVNPRATGL